MKIQEKQRALSLRAQGMSYSQIKNRLSVSKSTLSGWLKNYPLTKERIRELRGNNIERIERFRETMRKKREERNVKTYDLARKNIKTLSKREIFLAGLFLYWGEGYKTADTITAIANTDPAMIRFFIKWLSVMGVPVNKIRIKLNLYADMDKNKAIKFWSKELKLPITHFRQVYIKKSNILGLKYKNGFGYGTCNIMVGDRVLNDYVLMSLKYIRQELSNL